MHVQTTPAPSRRRPGFTAVALLSLAAFGCTTIRAPVTAIAPTIPVEDGRAAPQVELWLESGRPIAPRESERASAEVHAALRTALEGRRLDEGEQLLVVRAQGVSRTGSRKSDQTAAVAGIVVGAVVVVAAVVIAVVAGQGGGGKGGGKAGGKAGGATASGRPGSWAGVAGGGRGTVRPAPPGGARAIPGGRPAPPVRLGAPSRPAPPSGGWTRPHAPRHHHHAPVVNVWIGWSAEVRAPLLPLEVVEDGPVMVGAEQPPYAWLPPSLDGAAEAEAEATGEAEAEAAIRLPPLPPLELDERGFFDGDTLRLELTLVDRATGAPSWVKRVEKDVDPRDPRAVRALLDRALDDPKGWVVAGR
jgi:hypothetical protein